jgi:hypothetical protein
MSRRHRRDDSLNNIRRGELKRILGAQGVSWIEVHNAVEDIMAERQRWTATALGHRMKLTFAHAKAIARYCRARHQPAGRDACLQFRDFHDKGSC